MLTFFEYLRNRAYESIIEGASEALAYLEKEEKTSFEKMTEAAVLPPRKRESIGSENKSNESDPETHESVLQDDSVETSQAPRKRGRPRKSESRQ